MERDLRERTKQFALRIIIMFAKLPGTDIARVLGRQALRSGTSIGANYREASRARSKAEFVSKTGAERMAGLLTETRELVAIFTTINKRAKE